MARYCTNCGKRLDCDPRFCSYCGKPCTADGNRPPARNGGRAGRSTSSGIGKFFAGTAIGAFFMHLFGRSSSASASNHTHPETVEYYHDTVIYEDDDSDEDFDDEFNEDFHGDGYENGFSGFDEDLSCEDDWDSGYGNDDCGDGYDDDM